MSTIRVRNWVYDQNKRNERLPDLSREAVTAIVMKAYFYGVKILHEEACLATDYPLRNETNRFFLSPDRKFLLEVRPRESGPESVAILSVVDGA